jgi:hypothetical protein
MSISSQCSTRFAIVGIISVLSQNPVQAQTTFSDVRSDDWAAPFIRALVDRGVIAGFQDGSFRPNEPVTRAQFAALVEKAFDRPPVREATCFADLPSGYWATSAIDAAYREGFLSGYPKNIFNPAQPMPRAQVLVALTSGLQFKPEGSYLSVVTFKDLRSIPAYAQDGISAATERRLTVNYPDVEVLNPNRSTTRAEVAVSIYQALVASQKAPRIGSPYIVYDHP